MPQGSADRVHPAMNIPMELAKTVRKMVQIMSIIPAM
jgi:hypothetical protein